MFKTIPTPSSSLFTIGKILSTLLFISILSVIGLYIASMMPYNHYYKDDLLEYSFTLNLVIISLLLLNALYYIFFRSNRNLEKEGLLELREEAIVINGIAYPLDEIQYVRIKGNDIRDEFRGFFSKGYKNQLQLELKNKSKKTVSFLQTKNEKMKDKKELLTLYYEEGILSKANYDNLLNNTNYY